MRKCQRLLLDSAETIRRGGWCQGMYMDPAGGMCIMGAVMTTASCAGYSHRDEQKAFDLLGRFITNFTIAGWNDEPERTEDEVIAMLERAAEIGEPEKRRVLVPNEMPASPMSPDSPLWTDPTIPEPNPVRVPERVPA